MKKTSDSAPGARTPGKSLSVLRQRFALLIGVCALLVLVLLGLEFVSYYRSLQSNASLYQEHLKPQDNLTQLHGLVLRNQLLITEAKSEKTDFIQLFTSLDRNNLQILNLWKPYREQVLATDKSALPKLDALEGALFRVLNAQKIYADSIRVQATRDSTGFDVFFGQKFTLPKVDLSTSEQRQPFDAVIKPGIQTIDTEIDGLLKSSMIQAADKSMGEDGWLLKALSLGVGLLGLGLVIFLTIALSRYIRNRLQDLSTTLYALSHGELQRQSAPVTRDEFGPLAESINHLNSTLQRIGEFANEIGEGRFTTEFEPQSESDQLGASMRNMRDRLSLVAEEDRRRNWSIGGFAQFSEILRMSEDLKTLGSKTISFLNKYINANQGGFFNLDEDEQGEPILTMIGSYAYNSKKSAERSFRLGEGFVGQAAVEKELIYISDIPRDYVTMSSGLGEAPPRCLLIVPLVYNGETQGVIEFASLSNFRDHEIDFIKRLSETIGAALSNIKGKERTLRLLAESQKLSAELQNKQAELLSNNQIMEETQVEMLRTQQELTGQLSALNNAAIVSETDTAGNIIFVNDKFLSVSRYYRDELIGQNHRILKTDGMYAELAYDLWHTITSGRVWRGQLRNRAKDGTQYWVEATITPVMGLDGKPMKYISVQFDITNQKLQEDQIRTALEQAMAQEEELRQNTEELEASQEEMRRTQIELTGQINALNNSAIVSEADLQGRIISVNEQFLRISKFTREELIGQNHRILKSGHLADDVYENMWKTISSGQVWQGEFKNKSKDGIYYWVTATITPVLDTDGKPVKYIGVSFDVTSQKLQEEQIRAALEISQAQESELRQNAEELQQAHEEMRKTQIELRGQIGALNNAGIVAETDLRGNITLVNEAFCAISQYTREELLGQNHRILKSGEHNDEIYIELWERISTGKVWSGVLRNRAQDGHFYWVKTTITPVLGFDGKPVKYIGVSFDISPQIEQEEALQAALDISRSQEAELRLAAQTMEEQAVEIRAKQEQMDSIFANTPGIIYRRLQDDNWTMQVISEKVRDITGYGPEEFLQAENRRSFLTLIVPEDLEMVQQTTREALRSFDDFQLQYRILDRERNLKWVREEGAGVFDENGDLLYVDGAIFDITVQKELEDNLRMTLEQTQVQEQLLRESSLLMEKQQIELEGRIGALNNSGAVTETDLQGNIIFANDEACRTWGYTREELLGQNHRILRSPKQDDEFYKKMWDAISQGLVWKGEICNVSKDGAEVWQMLSITPVLDTNLQPVKYIAVSYDITRQRRQASRIRTLFEEAQKKEDELRLALADIETANQRMAQVQLELDGQIRALNNAAIVYEKDLDGKLTYVNDEATYIWGYSREELVGQPFDITRHPETPDRTYTRMWEKLRDGQVWTGDLRNRAKDGTEFWVNLTITPVMDTEGKPVKYIGVSFDITAQKQQSLRIRESLRVAEEQENAFKQRIETLEGQLSALVQERATQAPTLSDTAAVATLSPGLGPATLPDIGAGAALLRINPDGQVVWCNLGFQDRVNATLADIVGQSILYYVADAHFIEEAVSDATGAGVVTRIRLQQPTATGVLELLAHVQWVEPDEAEPYIQVVALDLTPESQPQAAPVAAAPTAEYQQQLAAKQEEIDQLNQRLSILQREIEAQVEQLCEELATLNADNEALRDLLSKQTT